MLPTEKMRKESPVWTIYDHLIVDLYQTWLLDTIRNEQKKNDPQLSEQTLDVKPSDSDLKSEMNRILGWTVKSACSQHKK